MKKLQDLMEEISEWSDATFGEMQRNAGIIAHLIREVKELADAWNKYEREPCNQYLYEFYEELADCMMLLLDTAAHADMDSRLLLNEVKRKLDINKKRRWGKANADGSIEHLKE